MGEEAQNPTTVESIAIEFRAREARQTECTDNRLRDVQWHEESKEHNPDFSRKEFPYLVGHPSTKFSESILWDQMRKFYQEQGVQAWSRGIVPFFITTNQLIANSYAKVIQSYLHDLYLHDQLEKSEPVHIFELGAGSGKFSFLLLKALTERMKLYYEDDPPFRIKYVMTDFSRSPFKFWQEHNALKRYFKSGVLDFAKLDACNDSTVKLELQGEEIQPGSLKNPVLVVANYLFDSLPADAYRVHNGELQEGLISVFSKQQENAHDDPAILNRFQPSYEWASVNTAIDENSSERIESQAERLILSWYASHFGKRSSSFLLPSASLKCLANIRALSKDKRLMVMSGDKGLSNTLAFQHGESHAEPHIAVHGSFSLMVNYHAIGLWFDALGGFALHCPVEDASLKVSAFIVHDVKENVKDMSTEHWNCYGEPSSDRLSRFKTLRIAFRETIASFSPDHFFQLQQFDYLTSSSSISKQHSINRNEGNPDFRGDEWLRSIISLLQLSDWDADLVFKFRDGILEHVCTCSSRLLDDLKRGMERAWENYFLLEPEKDLAFELGRFYYGLQNYERALVFYTKSSENAGKHHVTEHNIGLCHSSLGNKRQALDFFESSLELNPNYLKAQEQRNILRRQLSLPPAKPSLAIDLATSGDLVLSTSSPLNSPHVRVSFDPEVIYRSKTSTIN